TYAGFSKFQRPVLVVVGSETDSATSSWFPIGQWAGTFFEKTRDDEQKKALRTSIGNYLPYVTHRLSRADLPAGETGPHAAARHVTNCVCELPRAMLSNVDLQDIARGAATRPGRPADVHDEGWGSTPCEPERILGPLKLTCMPTERRGNPFWVVR